MTDDGSTEPGRERLERTVREQLARVGASAKATGAGLALVGVSAFTTARSLTGAFFGLTGDAIAEVYAEGKRVRAAERAATAAKSTTG